MKIEHVLFPSVSSKLRIRLMCSHDPFFGTNKNQILKNGSCERAFKVLYEFQLLFSTSKNTCVVALSALLITIFYLH